MKIKTGELTGVALDWAVHVANGGNPEDLYRSGSQLFTFLRDEDGNLNGCYMTGPSKMPSRLWEAAGPIIERMKGLHIKNWLSSRPESQYEVHLHNDDGDWIEFGPTLLIAAMRCFVASKLGDEVDVPEELLK